MACSNCSSPLTTSSFPLPAPCAQTEGCEEALPGACVRYQGPNLPSLGISSGMFLKDALVALNKKLTSAQVSRSYTITTTGTQVPTVVEFINLQGALSRVSITAAQSPRTICAQENSPVIISGTGSLSSAGATCTA